MNSRLFYLVIGLIVVITFFSLGLNIWLLYQKNAVKSNSNPDRITVINSINFFDSFTGQTFAELIDIKGDILTFKNSNGVALPFRKTDKTFIMGANGTATSSAELLKIGKTMSITGQFKDNSYELITVNTAVGPDPRTTVSTSEFIKDNTPSTPVPAEKKATEE